MRKLVLEGDTVEIYDVNTTFGFYPYRKIDTSINGLLTVLKKNGISKALTLSMKGIYYDFEEGNQETLSVCCKNEYLIPVATLNPIKVSDCEKETKKIVEQGFKAVRIFPEIQNWSLESRAFNEILDMLDYFNMPVITSESPEKFSNMAKHIKTPVIFLSCHYYKLYETLAVFKERKNFYAEIRHMTSPDAIEVFIEKLGVHRLVFGSNAPLGYVGSVVEQVKTAKISYAEKTSILHNNFACIICENTVTDRGENKH